MFVKQLQQLENEMSQNFQKNLEACVYRRRTKSSRQQSEAVKTVARVV